MHLINSLMIAVINYLIRGRQSSMDSSVPTIPNDQVQILSA